jgi:thymidylate synthase
MKEAILHGDERSDRTGVGTYSLFGAHLDVPLKAGYPAATTKQLFFKPVKAELLWFLEGSGDERRLAEIQHGSRDLENRTIWSDNADDTTGSKYTPEQYGDLGRVYGVQWRSWKTFVEAGGDKLDGGLWAPGEPVDQIKNLIDGLKRDPHGRRHIVSAWNPGELDQMALPPCHMMAQFYVNSKDELSCQMYQRSADLFLGVPFNVASYALLTHMIAQVCGYGVDKLRLVFGDAHVYKNHVDQVRRQAGNPVLSSPSLELDPSIKDIQSFTMDSIKLVGYKHAAPIKAPMAK